MTEAPFLSILTITKDDPYGLARTKASLKAQSECGFEWIVIDGALEPDAGIYDAMNKGLIRAAGDYILFLNGGDAVADPETISLLKRHIHALPSDFIYGDAMEEIGGKLMVQKARDHTHLPRGLFTHHQAMIYKRSVIGDMRYNTDYKIAGDYDFTARYLKRCKDISYIPAPLIWFEQGGISQRNAVLGRREEFKSKIENHLCGRWSACGIYARQHLAFSVKKRAPGLYRALRSVMAS